MVKQPKIQLFDFIMSISETIDLISPLVANHHFKVAYIAYMIGYELNLPPENLNDLIIAGALHDIGALSFKERIDALQFELENPYKHAELSYQLLKTYLPFSKIAELVRFHHVPWNYGEGAEFSGKAVPLGSHILHLADRIAVLTGSSQMDILRRSKEIVRRVESQSNRLFLPELVEAFKNVAVKESFWLEVTSPFLSSVLKSRVTLPVIELQLETLLDVAKLFSHIIDFRSRFTATHSSGVAATAEYLAKLCGFSGRECLMMSIAGYLHDLGKLAVPVEILEKNGSLTKKEFDIVKSHPFFTYRILEPLKGLEEITAWASFHHEKLDGSGYPFHYKAYDLPLGSRIMSVADVFCAITEDRPYRKGMTKGQAVKVLEEMVKNSALDFYVVDVLKSSFEEVNRVRKRAEKAAAEEYRSFYENLTY
ncbi:HD-GYP domain, c-di-GMP phosphodiesterase class II (or its inactivated variant) [Caldanaerovirga acetigignens]|uniref:HD-GYP domain, c-di-GMP phosphodiesterase class II (Or its inactivated variant) n=1 Tax=Caldanaerovirga acetigignens TaxID=447595 RepID=A0A1M7JSY2_9FIRM|nr:HD domain-containing phosphohydrolase [Caldanaerovirga acetigignens]SHM56142.1 HD-GYP domain, c-di-GMP phosphodiesterase class II (or its inactivated variant) [Caldanaerovirga acetigignens]